MKACTAHSSPSRMWSRRGESGSSSFQVGSSGAVKFRGLRKEQQHA
jgi:hypothetical protein